MSDHPIHEIAETAGECLLQGDNFVQKFTCPSCGVRQFVSVPDAIFTSHDCVYCNRVAKLKKGNYARVSHRYALRNVDHQAIIRAILERPEGRQDFTNVFQKARTLAGERTLNLNGDNPTDDLLAALLGLI